MMMKKEMLLFVVLVFLFAADNILSTESSQKTKTVKMFHCTRYVSARLILKEGIKSRSQLVHEGKAVPFPHMSFPDHDDNIYFQYINEKDLEKIEPGLWYNKKAINRRFLHCVAMEFDLDETMVYNPDLRFWPPENNCDYDITVRDPIHASLDIAEREGIYKKSGMTLRQYIAKKEYFEKGNHNCFWWSEVIQDPFTADVRCVGSHVSHRYTAYIWNEHTVKKDRIDPSEFAQ